MDKSRVLALLAVASVLVSFSMLVPPSAAGAQQTTVYVPPATGCTTPGDAAPASLLQSLANPSPGIAGFTLKGAPADVRDAGYGFIIGAGLLALMVLVGIILLVAHFVRRGNVPPVPGQRRSHRTRNAFFSIFLILILVTGASFYVIYPYLGNGSEGPGAGELDNFLTPTTPIPLAPGGVETNPIQTYPNGHVTLLAGNFSVPAGEQVQVVIIADSERSAWVNELRNGTFAGQGGCPNMGDLSVLYDSGPTASGAFNVQIPVVSHDTLYDLAFANPSNSQITVAANVYYGFQ